LTFEAKEPEVRARRSEIRRRKRLAAADAQL